jgi:hypothetical protein
MVMGTVGKKAQKGDLSQRSGSPSFSRMLFEPGQDLRMLLVRGPGHRYQNIDIEQVGHAISSSSSRTCSRVTLGESGGSSTM